MQLTTRCHLLLLAAFGFTAAAKDIALAGEMVPLKAKNQGAVAVSGYDASTGVLTISTQFDFGTSTLFGHHTGLYEAKINVQTGVAQPPEITVISPNGRDKYFAVYQVIGPDPSDPTNPLRAVAHAQITGGAGRFAGASGQYTVKLATDKTGEQLIAAFLGTGQVVPAHYVAIVDGQISAPSPPQFSGP